MYRQEILSNDSWLSIKLKARLSVLIGYFRKKINDMLELYSWAVQRKVLHLIFNRPTQTQNIKRATGRKRSSAAIVAKCLGLVSFQTNCQNVGHGTVHVKKCNWIAWVKFCKGEFSCRFVYFTAVFRLQSFVCMYFNWLFGHIFL